MTYQERRRELQALRKKRGELLDKLNALLGARSQHQKQGDERERLLKALQVSRAAALSAQEQLQKVRADAQALQSSNAQRRARLERQQGQVQTNRTDMLSSYFPHLLRYQSLTHQHVSSMLLHEQKLKLKQVLDILPLQVEGLLPAPGVGLGPGLSGDGSSVALAICGLHIPEQAVQLVDGRLPPEASSAALGYALLLLDLLATYLGGPLLHEGSFQGSTSVVWQQQSFWNRRPASSSCVLPLFVEDSPQANILLPASKPAATSWSLGGLMRTGAAADAAPGSRPGVDDLRHDSLDEAGPLQGSKYEDMQAAHTLLQRSMACFVRDLVALLPGVYLPPSWSSASWLALLCGMYHRDAHTEGLLSEAQRLSEGAAAQAASMTVTSLPAPPSSSGSAGLGMAGCEPELSLGRGSQREGVPTPSRHEDEDVEEDWDVLLPPKPSESDAELEHWMRLGQLHRVHPTHGR